MLNINRPCSSPVFHRSLVPNRTDRILNQYSCLNRFAQWLAFRFTSLFDAKLQDVLAVIQVTVNKAALLQVWAEPLVSSDDTSRWILNPWQIVNILNLNNSCHPHTKKRSDMCCGLGALSSKPANSPRRNDNLLWAAQQLQSLRSPVSRGWGYSSEQAQRQDHETNSHNFVVTVTSPVLFLQWHIQEVILYLWQHMYNRTICEFIHFSDLLSTFVLYP